MDSEYLKRHVGKALSEGLAEVCLKRPVDPIEHLALWLRKYVENEAYDKEQKEQQIQLKHEMEVAEKEARFQAQMREEAESLSRQEAYEKAATEPVTIDTTPRPLPPELNKALETVAEREEEDELGPGAVESNVDSNVQQTESEPAQDTTGQSEGTGDSNVQQTESEPPQDTTRQSEAEETPGDTPAESGTEVPNNGASEAQEESPTAVDNE